MHYQEQEEIASPCISFCKYIMDARVYLIHVRDESISSSF